MNFEFSLDPTSRDVLFRGRIPETEILSSLIVEATAKEIVRLAAEAVMKEYGAAIMAKVDINAIANMVIATAAAEISAKINERLK